MYCISEANLSEANLSEANLSEANLIPYKMEDVQPLDDVSEFCELIGFLNDKELSILQQTFLKDELEQLKTLRRLRPQTENYGTLYNAYCARVLVTDPNRYIEKEIIKRFIYKNIVL